MTMAFSKILKTGLLAVMMVIVLVDPAWACPNCKNAVAQTNTNMAQAFAWSIGLMMLVPAAILGFWVAAFHALRKQAACL